MTSWLRQLDLLFFSSHCRSVAFLLNFCWTLLNWAFVVFSLTDPYNDHLTLLQKRFNLLSNLITAFLLNHKLPQLIFQLFLDPVLKILLEFDQLPKSLQNTFKVIILIDAEFGHLLLYPQTKREEGFLLMHDFMLKNYY